MNLSIVFTLISLFWPMQVTIVPGDSAKGAELFEDKNCIQCHSFNGRGAHTAPDLGQRPAESRSPSELAGALWNHAPAMWKSQTTTGRFTVLIDSSETADLFAYFYSLFYFDRPGDNAAGMRVFDGKCAGCHRTGADTWNPVRDPMAWFARMWNHPGMKTWPMLTSTDMTNLLTYLSSVSGTPAQVSSFHPGNPNAGLNVFERECESCHTFGGPTTERRVDLLAVPAPRTLIDYAVAMWNHAGKMRRAGGGRLPEFSAAEFNDLTAYLFAERYFSEKGDAVRGAQVYIDKGCASCHDLKPLGKYAPDLTQSAERFSPITLTAALWRSGPAMEEAIQRKNMAWPEFHGTEMTDLIAVVISGDCTMVASCCQIPATLKPTITLKEEGWLRRQER